MKMLFYGLIFLFISCCPHECRPKWRLVDYGFGNWRIEKLVSTGFGCEMVYVIRAYGDSADMARKFDILRLTE